MNSIKLSNKWLNILCITGGAILGVLVSVTILYVSINKNVTRDGKFVKVPYCEIEEYIGDEFCSGDDCKPVETCLSGWETRSEPLWEYISVELETNISIGIIAGMFIGLLVALGIEGHMKYRD